MAEQLRPYQIEALDAVRNRKVQRGIIAIPTGTGKGHIAGHLVEALKSKHILYLAHRGELIDQLEDHVERILGWGKVSVDMADRKASPFTPAVVASVQTLIASDCKRLKRLGKFDAVVCDEGHLGTADSYIKIWQHFGLLDENKIKTENPTTALIGLTATPSRGDNVGLINVFDEILYQMSLAKAIKDGWLVPVYAFTIKTNTNLDNVKIRMGDYSEKELTQVVSTEERNEIVFDACQKNAKNLKSLIFCVNIEHSQIMAEYFKDRGVEAKYVSGEMSKFERGRTFAWFANTPGAVLTNCQLVTEGVDIPSVECVVMACPTKSKTLYAQMMGRGTRLAKGARDYTHSIELGKDRCILLDITDSLGNVGRRAVTVGDIFGAPLPTKMLDGVDMLEEVKEQEEIIEKARRGEFTGSEAIPVNLFAMPANIPNATMAWLDYGDMYRLSLAARGDISIQADTLDRWNAIHFNPDLECDSPIFQNIGGQEEIVKSVEEWVKKNCSDVLILTDRNARWRKDEPSPGQRSLCRRLHIPIPAGASKGEVSMIIDRRLKTLQQKKVGS